MNNISLKISEENFIYKKIDIQENFDSDSYLILDGSEHWRPQSGNLCYIKTDLGNNFPYGDAFIGVKKNGNGTASGGSVIMEYIWRGLLSNAGDNKRWSDIINERRFGKNNFQTTNELLHLEYINKDLLQLKIRPLKSGDTAYAALSSDKKSKADALDITLYEFYYKAGSGNNAVYNCTKIKTSKDEAPKKEAVEKVTGSSKNQCWRRMPQACGQTLGEPGSGGTGLVWFVDPHISPKTSAACDARASAFNNWCRASGANSVQTHWGQKPKSDDVEKAKKEAAEKAKKEAAEKAKKEAAEKAKKEAAERENIQKRQATKQAAERLAKKAAEAKVAREKAKKEAEEKAKKEAEEKAAAEKAAAEKAAAEKASKEADAAKALAEKAAKEASEKAEKAEAAIKSAKEELEKARKEEEAALVSAKEAAKEAAEKEAAEKEAVVQAAREAEAKLIAEKEEEIKAAKELVAKAVAEKEEAEAAAEAEAKSKREEEKKSSNNYFIYIFIVIAVLLLLYIMVTQNQ